MSTNRFHLLRGWAQGIFTGAFVVWASGHPNPQAWLAVVVCLAFDARMFWTAGDA